MPTYAFRCKKCGAEYETITKYDETGKYRNVICPECGSRSKVKKPVVCGFQFSNPIGTDRWNSQSKGHDYRFKHNAPNVKAERAAAEANSHMGNDPYQDTSESDIAMDTGIHDNDGPIMLQDN